MNTKNAPQIPVKWLAVILFALVVYGLGQPLANRTLGWQLPSLANLLGDHQSAHEQLKNESKSNDSRQTAAAPKSSSGEPRQLAKGSDTQSNKSNTTAAKESKTTKPQDSTQPAKTKDEKLLYGLLKETGREEYTSPTGLRFTRGSEEGHRLKHLERHLQDLPDRPGKHGVFKGDMPQVLRWLDEAYSRAKAGAKGTSQRDEEGRTIYEVNFSKPIGYIGGREGARQKNPDSKRLRLVVEGDRLITAFPF